MRRHVFHRFRPLPTDTDLKGSSLKTYGHRRSARGWNKLQPLGDTTQGTVYVFINVDDASTAVCLARCCSTSSSSMRALGFTYIDMCCVFVLHAELARLPGLWPMARTGRLDMKGGMVEGGQALTVPLECGQGQGTTALQEPRCAVRRVCGAAMPLTGSHRHSGGVFRELLQQGNIGAACTKKHALPKSALSRE